MIERSQILALPLFDGLEGEQLAVALAAFKPFEVGPGELLMDEGEPDRSLMIVIEGELQVSLGGVDLGRVSQGETVGEMALFGSFDRRTASVRTTTGPTRLLVLDEDALRFLRIQDNPVGRALEVAALNNTARRLREMDFRIARMAAGLADQRQPQRSLMSRLTSSLLGGGRPKGAAPDVMDVLAATSGFANKDPEVLANIAARLRMVSATAGENIIEEGQQGDDAFIVAAGHIGVLCRTEQGTVERVATLGPGHIFGHVSLTDSRVRSATCRALEAVYLVRIPGPVYRQFEIEQTSEGRVFRRGIIDALAAQLRLANEHYLQMVRTARSGS